MQARLSVDIVKNGHNSRFARTARGRFALRSQLDKPYAGGSAAGPSDGSTKVLREYIAEPRVLSIPAEQVLCCGEQTFRDILTFQGIDTDAQSILDRMLRPNLPFYVARAEAERRNDAKQFITYVLVQCGQRLLFFRRSYLSRAAEFLRGSKCIGFGGHVTEADADMLSYSDKGLTACARRELAEELFLPAVDGRREDSREAIPTVAGHRPSRATVALFRDAPLEQLGVLNDDSSEVGRRHVAIVYRVWLNDWHVARQLQKGDSSVKALNWLDLSEEKVDISEFEYWSQLCLRKFYPSNVYAQSFFRVATGKKAQRNHPIVVAGRIGSGKTVTSQYLSSRLQMPLITSGDLLEQIMGVPPISEIGRAAFQTRALEFIRSPEGPQLLAARIVQEIAKVEGSPIIDGIRHIATYEQLTRNLRSSANLLFVNTPPDVAFEMYRSREVRDELTFTYRDFLGIYDAEVESDIPSLGREAHAYLYNPLGIEAFRRSLEAAAVYFENIP